MWISVLKIPRAFTHITKLSNNICLPSTPYDPKCSFKCLRIGGIEILNDPITNTLQPTTVNGNFALSMFALIPLRHPTIAFVFPVEPYTLENARDTVINHTLLARASIFNTLSTQLKRFHAAGE
jgi:hypothetical protein